MSGGVWMPLNEVLDEHLGRGLSPDQAAAEVLDKLASGAVLAKAARLKWTSHGEDGEVVSEDDIVDQDQFGPRMHTLRSGGGTIRGYLYDSETGHLCGFTEAVGVLLRRRDVERAWAATEAGSRMAIVPEDRPGPKPKYDWDAFHIELARIAFHEGLPSQKELKHRLHDWFAKQGLVVGKTSMDDKVRRFWQALTKADA